MFHPNARKTTIKPSTKGEREMKRFFYVALAAILATMIIACDHPSGGCNTGKTIKLTETDNGEVIKMTLADQIEITLPSNATTGFTWENALTEGSILVQEGEAVYANDPTCEGRPGCGGVQIFTFKAVSAGTGKIKLIYRQPWSSEEPSKQFEVTVNVN
jgi:inhibitor of cysteine peptidase